MNNRPIKFRVWDVEQNKFLPSYADKGIEFYHEQGKNWHEKQIRDIVPVSWFLQDHNNNLGNYIVTQYTGLNDKNDKEIYEGDFIRGMFDFGPAGYKEEILPVVWDNEKGYQWNHWDLSTIEVIGNKHEWPCRKPGSFDHNGECLICDCWATDCPFFKLSDIKTTTV